MSGILDDQTIDFPCPKCGHKHRKTVAWLKANRHLTCSRCAANIAIDNSNFVSGIQKVDKAMDDLRRTLRSLGK